MFCLPVPKDRYLNKSPWIIASIVVIDGIFLIPSLAGNKTAFLSQYGLTPNHVTLLTFFASIFLHAGIWHYVGNMWFFWIFGRRIESCLGYFKFALCYLLCGIGANTAYVLLNLHSSIACVGASGAISGIAGMYFILFPKDRFDLHIYVGYWRVKTIETVSRTAVGAWIGEQALLAIITMFSAFSSTAFSAHVGGFLVGTCLGLLYHSQVPAENRPELPLIAIGEDIDNVEMPSDLVSLGLSSSAKEKEHI